jgi:hypothetical protein
MSGLEQEAAATWRIRFIMTTRIRFCVTAATLVWAATGFQAAEPQDELTAKLGLRQRVLAALDDGSVRQTQRSIP